MTKITYESINSIVDLVKMCERLAEVLQCSVSRAVEIHLLTLQTLSDTKVDTTQKMMEQLKSASEKVQ